MDITISLDFYNFLLKRHNTLTELEKILEKYKDKKIDENIDS